MLKARAEYSSYLEQIKAEKEEKRAEKRKLEEEEHLIAAGKIEKGDLQQKLFDCSTRQKEILEEEKAFHSLLIEANKKLLDAINNKDLNSIKVAQMILDTGNQNFKLINESTIRQELSVAQKKLTKIIKV